MHHQTLLDFFTLLFTGLLAGEELAVCFGVRVALRALEMRPQIQIRQVLIRRLRILVPMIYLPALLFTLATTVSTFYSLDTEGPRPLAFYLDGLAALCLIKWAAITFLGTVPINKDALGWRPEAPPENWRARVARWEQLDVIRCLDAISAFIFLLLRKII